MNCVEKITELIRGATRPVVTIIFAVAILQVVTQRIDAPEWFIGLAITVIGWWFVGRAREHIKNKTLPPLNKGRGSR